MSFLTLVAHRIIRTTRCHAPSGRFVRMVEEATTLKRRLPPLRREVQNENFIDGFAALRWCIDFHSILISIHQSENGWISRLSCCWCCCCRRCCCSCCTVYFEVHNFRIFRQFFQNSARTCRDRTFWSRVGLGQHGMIHFFCRTCCSTC